MVDYKRAVRYYADDGGRGTAAPEINAGRLSWRAEPGGGKTMILADKIIRLRKRNGWSQEELAEKMQVSRQAVSKWEGAQTIPDIEKILLLGRLFGVTTDYLLKDDMEDEEFADDGADGVKRLSLAQANEFLAWRQRTAARKAGATLLCVISAIPLLLLGALSEWTTYISGDFAGVLGIIILLALVAAAVAVFISCSDENAPHAFIYNEPFETDYGVSSMVRERQNAFAAVYKKYSTIATCICVLSPIPLLTGAMLENEFYMVILLCVTIAIAGLGAAIFVALSEQRESMQQLLKEGEFSPDELRNNRVMHTVSKIYWMLATAIYLAWSFSGMAWKNTWIVWPIAGVLYAPVRGICRLIIDREK